MKETKTLDFFDDYDFENQSNQETASAKHLLGGEIWYNQRKIIVVFIIKRILQ